MIAEIEVALLVTPVALAPPIVTVAPVKLVPVIVIGVPPANTPKFGSTEVIVGIARYENVLSAVTVPPAVLTWTVLLPAVPEGVVACSNVGPRTLTLVHSNTESINTTVAPVTNPVPTITRLVPPSSGPLVGVTLETVGAAT